MRPPFRENTVNNETRAPESVTTGTRGPSRRTLVRTAAWSVPVISTVAAAPAFAAASDKLTVTPSGPSIPDGKFMDVTLTIQNPGGPGNGSLPAAGVAVSFATPTTPGKTLSFTGATIQSSTPTGWSTSGTTANFGGSIPNNGSSVIVTIRLTFKSNKKPHKDDVVSLSGTVTATGFVNASFTTSAVSKG